MRDTEYSPDLGDTVICNSNLNGIVEEVLSHGWLRIKLMPYIAKWDVVHISQVSYMEKKDE